MEAIVVDESRGGEATPVLVFARFIWPREMPTNLFLQHEKQ